MALIYAQPLSGFHPFVLITPGQYTQVEYFLDTEIQFTDSSGTVIASDTIKAHDPALTIVGTDMPSTPQSLFDNSYLWYVVTIYGSHTLSLCLASQIANIETFIGGFDYAILGRVLATDVADYEQ